MQTAEIAAQFQAIVEAEPGDPNTMVSRLNNAMRNLWQIDWCGQFGDMCQRDGEFPFENPEHAGGWDLSVCNLWL